MRNLPKKDIFTVPEGYFEELPHRIHQKRKNRNQRVWLVRMAAAAVFVLGIAIFVFQYEGSYQADYHSKMDEDVELYINSGYWNEDDLLWLADNPNDILDDIIWEEWDYDDWEEEFIENEIRF